jgi:hypothetical protein
MRPIQHWRETVNRFTILLPEAVPPRAELRDEIGGFGDNPHHVSFDPVLHPPNSVKIVIACPHPATADGCASAVAQFH